MRVTSVNVRRIYAVAGIVGALSWIGLTFVPPMDGASASVARDHEIFWNRLWSPALLGMLLGAGALRGAVHSSLKRMGNIGFTTMLVGFGLMIIGNSSEYWFFHELPHEGPDGFIRGIAWMTCLLGVLLVLLASTIVGFSLVAANYLPAWIGVVFMAPLPLTIAIGFANMRWAGVPIGALSIVIGCLGLLLGSMQPMMQKRPPPSK